jgi:hypothetical protein
METKNKFETNIGSVSKNNNEKNVNTAINLCCALLCVLTGAAAVVCVVKLVFEYSC